MSRQITLVLKGYPRLSETFIAQEIRALEKRGLNITLASLRHPTDRARHPIHGEIEADVLYLPEYLHQEPWRVLRAWWQVRRRPGYRRCLKRWWQDFGRDRSRNRIRRLGQAFVLASELPPDTEQLYAHFLHTPASVTRYCALITGLPWSASAHAKDIWTSDAWELREKLAELDWLATCTEANHRYLSGLADDPDKVHLVYHGLDFSRFPAPKPSVQSRDGGDNSNPVRLISVGRAVAKKGYDDLLSALAALPREQAWQLTHIGGGPLLDTLKKQADALGIGDRIRWLGALAQHQVLEHYRQADLFVLASKIVEDGDRDGLPNVLMEAQSQGLACLATGISGIPELIRDRQTGWLVEPADPAALNKALQTLIADPALRWRPAWPASNGYARPSMSSAVSISWHSCSTLRAATAGTAPCSATSAPAAALHEAARSLLCATETTGSSESLRRSPAGPPADAGAERSRLRCPARQPTAQPRCPGQPRAPTAPGSLGATAGRSPATPLATPGLATETLVHLSPLLQGGRLDRPQGLPRTGHPLCCRRGLLAGSRAEGPWALSHQCLDEALQLAQRLFTFNPTDIEGLQACLGGRAPVVALPPFLDLANLPRTAEPDRTRLAALWGLNSRLPG
ncbi:glycosyltransferase [Marinobacterium aestuariivivens]|uniref:Glycosyltransferase n=1 Tax=Marinobacterium aestuariivivens TaxID=1698799 RepID=A0ABW1ZVF9_9GAMM